MNRLAAIVAPAAGFFDWWLSELQALGTSLTARLAPGLSKHLLARVSRQGLQLFTASESMEAEIARLERVDTGLASEFHHADSQLPPNLSGRRVTLIFAAEFGFVQHRTLPVAALPHLAAAIDLQLPRLLPLPASSMRTVITVESIDTQLGAINARVAALKNSHIAVATRAVEALGLRPHGLELQSSRLNEANLRFDGTSSGGPRAQISRLTLSLAASALALLLSASVISMVESYRAENRLDHELSAANAASASVMELRQQLQSDIETLAIPAVAERTPSAAALLADVTTRVPQSSWVTTLELKEGELRLVGVTDNPAGLVERLSQSSLLQNVTLRNSATVLGQNGRDRFEISARMRGPK